MLARTIFTGMSLGLLASCSGDPETTDVCAHFETSFTTLDRFGQSAAPFGTTEVVRLQHTARNRSNTTQTLDGISPGCGSGPVDIKNAAGTSVYSQGRDPGPASPCVVTPFQLTFGPNETKTYQEDWNTPRSDGQSRNLAAGDYVATYRSGLERCASTFDKSRAFTLR